MQDQLLETLRQSKRVFAVLTETFIKDPWCLLQFRMAMAEKLESSSSRLIGKHSKLIYFERIKPVLVILHGQPSFHEMPEDIESYVRKTTHIKTESCGFGDKLR